MSHRRKRKGLKVDPAVRAAREVDRSVERSLAGDWHDEVLRLRGVVSAVADAVGVRAVFLGPGLIGTRDEILYRLSADALRRENLQWREYAWLSCVHDMNGKYGDDGEMQCRGTDFRRDPIEALSDHLRMALTEGQRLAAATELFPDRGGW